MKKMLTLRAIQTLHGNAAATNEILVALSLMKGNMRETCDYLGVGKSSMYRLINDLGAQPAIDKLISELGVKIQGKVLEEVPPPPKKRAKKLKAEPISDAPKPRTRVRKVA